MIEPLPRPFLIPPVTVHDRFADQDMPTSMRPAPCGNAHGYETDMEAALRRVASCDCGEETSCYGCPADPPQRGLP
ncbi:hypothetical protein [Acrocarpospora sp. B8E8]|uniref:hypothetical protein n=1 Tax=Acrocarpospora sp. B8E8 TaxID=3153572 RepID=UPI00325F4A03